MISDEKKEWFESKSWIMKKERGFIVIASDIEISDEFIANHDMDEIEKIIEIEQRLHRIHSRQRLANTHQEIIIQVVYRLKQMIYLSMIFQITIFMFLAISLLK